MTIFKIAASNMARNLEQYLVYFITVTISVLISFTFLSLGDNAFLEGIFKKWGLGGAALFKSSALLLLIFIICFIFYSNSYFIQRRKREFGLYSLLGLRKIEIVGILVVESLLLYALALILGVVMGILFSKLFLMLLLWAINLRMDTHLMISVKAIIETAVVFLFILALIALYSTFFIFKSRLISLFQAEMRPLKGSKGLLFPTIAGLLLILFGYWLALRNIERSDIIEIIGSVNAFFLIILFSVIMGTFLVFRYGLLYFVHLFYDSPRFAYRSSNLITLTSLRYRLKKIALTLTTIATLSAVTLTAISAVSSFYYFRLSQLTYENPSSYQILDLSPEKQAKIEKIIHKNKDHRLVYKFNTEVSSFNIDKVKKGVYHDFGAEMAHVQFVSRQDFNRLSKLEKNGNSKVGKLAPGEAVWVGKRASQISHDERKKIKRESLKLRDVDTEKKVDDVKVVGFRNYNVFDSYFVGELFVVEDSYYQKVLKKETRSTKVTIYEVTNSKQAEELSKKIQIEVDGKFDFLESKVYNYFSNYRLVSILFGSFLYIFSFIGVVFFLATGSIIYFKQMTEAYEERKRFETLIKLGFTEKELRKVIRRQIAPLFLFPLLFGLAHSLAAINSLLLNVFIETYESMTPIVIITVIYCLFYIVYYLLCIKSYSKIVMRKYP